MRWVEFGEFQACFGSLVLEWSRSAVAERAEKMKRTKLTALIMLSSVSVTRQTPAFPLIQCNWCKCKRKKASEALLFLKDGEQVVTLRTLRELFGDKVEHI